MPANNQKSRGIQKRGALLLELLIAISLLAVIMSVAANGVFLSMRSNKVSAERNISNALATEALEAGRSVTEENWNNVYNLTKGSQHYYPVQSAGKWTLVAGDETITVNGISYTRYIILNNVSRDGTTRNIESSYVSADDDPSTQQATATVSWTSGSPASVTFSNYYFRWKNLTCSQASWATGGTGNTVEPCSATTYDVKDSGVNVTGGIHLQ